MRGGTREQEKIRLRKKAIENAINTWERMKAGEVLPHMGGLKRSPEYCEKQIKYFKNLQLK